MVPVLRPQGMLAYIVAGLLRSNVVQCQRGGDERQQTVHGLGDLGGRCSRRFQVVVVVGAAAKVRGIRQKVISACTGGDVSGRRPCFAARALAEFLPCHYGWMVGLRSELGTMGLGCQCRVESGRMVSRASLVSANR
jgi:hypothetical protein